MATYTKKTHLTHIVLNPDRNPVGSVIWLHGLGADGADFIPAVLALDLLQQLPLRFIFPHAPLRPVTLNNGYVMRAWFDLYSLDMNQKIDHQGINESLKIIHNFINEENSAGITTDKIILAGFSQGAMLAMACGLNYPERLAGIIGLSGCLPQANTLITEAQAANSGLPIFVGHGTEDTVIPVDFGRQTAELLQKNGYAVSWHHYPFAHSVGPEEIQDLRAWLCGVFGG